MTKAPEETPGLFQLRPRNGITIRTLVPASDGLVSISIEPSNSASTSVRTICRPRPDGVLHGEAVRQADPVVTDHDVEFLGRPLDGDRDQARRRWVSGTNACCSAFCTTSANTITSGVASSAPRMPNDPEPAHPGGSLRRRDIGDHRHQPVHDLVQIHPIVG